MGLYRGLRELSSEGFRPPLDVVINHLPCKRKAFAQRINWQLHHTARRGGGEHGGVHSCHFSAAMLCLKPRADHLIRRHLRHQHPLKSMPPAARQRAGWQGGCSRQRKRNHQHVDLVTTRRAPADTMRPLLAPPHCHETSHRNPDPRARCAAARQMAGRRAWVRVGRRQVFPLAWCPHLPAGPFPAPPH